MIERYIRTTTAIGGCTLEPGLEWRDGDDFGRITAELQSMASLVANMRTDAVSIGKAFGDLIRDHWPSRFYFVEVFAGDGTWSQEYLPCGSRPRGKR